MKKAFIGLAVFFLLLALPVSKAVIVKTTVYSALEIPLDWSRQTARWFTDLWDFRRNAREIRRLRLRFAEVESKESTIRQLKLENARLSKLLNIRQANTLSFKKIVFSRVIARSPSAWNRVFLIDKGFREGVRPNMVVLSDFALLGKVVEAGPSVSKVLLLQDPNFRVGVVLSRTRQAGVMYGSVSGRCLVKYLSAETEIKAGDEVETAGYGALFPKGVRVGRVTRARKEAGGLYQEAEVKLLVDPGNAEEVTCVH
ncbi:MAG: rod shape-determining protein MreC [Candidatus Omnitrophica bacterium]|nr:rod shape-determining protein MreC [Candidatus Omnitrophota bacterium]